MPALAALADAMVKHQQSQQQMPPTQQQSWIPNPPSPAPPTGPQFGQTVGNNFQLAPNMAPLGALLQVANPSGAPFQASPASPSDYNTQVEKTRYQL